MTQSPIIKLVTLTLFLHSTIGFQDNDYLTDLKTNCFSKGEAISCLKYKAIKEATKSFIGDGKVENTTTRSYDVISLVPLETVETFNASIIDEEFNNKDRGFLSEWTQLTVYWMKLLTEFFTQKGLRIELPDGARSITIDEDYPSSYGESRGKKKKLAIILPLISLLATLKIKALLIPVLLAVLFIKKLLLAAALLVPSLLSTLKACKLHHHHHAAAGLHYGIGASDVSSEFSSAGYGSGYSYSGNKDWPASRAYNLQRPKVNPVYAATSPGAAIA